MGYHSVGFVLGGRWVMGCDSVGGGGLGYFWWLFVCYSIERGDSKCALKVIKSRYCYLGIMSVSTVS